MTHPQDELEAIEIDLLVEAIRRRYGYDFSDYAPASRARRMRDILSVSGARSFAELQGQVLRDAALFRQLLESFTITTSEMFRDPEVFTTLREQVIPVLRTYPEVRIWHAGCAHGEEVYSLAILLTEEGLYDRARIYATDVNPRAVEGAREGVYSADSLRVFTANYQAAGGRRSFSDYYTAAHGFAAMLPALRRNVTFAEHNLATDAPFGSMHLVLCRNVFIYFDRALQERASTVLRDSLIRRGYLVLGTRETLGFTTSADAFEELVRGQRVFRLR